MSELAQLWEWWIEDPEVSQDLTAISEKSRSALKLVDYSVYREVVVPIPNDKRHTGGIADAHLYASQTAGEFAGLYAELTDLVGQIRRMERALKARWLNFVQRDPEHSRKSAEKVESFLTDKGVSIWSRAADRAKSFQEGLDGLMRMTTLSLRWLDDMQKWM